MRLAPEPGAFAPAGDGPVGLAGHLLNDRGVPVAGRDPPPGVVRRLDGDTEGAAMAHLKARPAEVELRRVVPNTAGDRAFSEREAHLSPCARDASSTSRRGPTPSSLSPCARDASVPPHEVAVEPALSPCARDASPPIARSLMPAATAPEEDADA